MKEPKLPSWMNYSDYEDIMHYLRLFGEIKPYYLKAEDVFNAEQEVMKRKMDDGLRLIDVAKEMIWSYKYKERWHQLPKDENMNLENAKKLLKENGYLVEKEEGNYYSVTICYTDTNGELATKTKIEFTDNDKLAESNALAWFKKKFEYETIRWIDSEGLKLKEAKQILKKNGFILEGSMSLEDKIEHAQDFNVDNRIENSSGFGTSIKNIYGKTILAQLKKKALKKGFDKDYIDSVEETMLHDDKIFDTATDFIEDVTDENYDLERLNVNQLLKKYGNEALKYVLKEIFNYYYEA